jgi:hypothetical protein
VVKVHGPIVLIVQNQDLVRQIKGVGNIHGKIIADEFGVKLLDVVELVVLFGCLYVLIVDKKQQFQEGKAATHRSGALLNSGWVGDLGLIDALHAMVAALFSQMAGGMGLIREVSNPVIFSTEKPIDLVHARLYIVSNLEMS